MGIFLNNISLEEAKKIIEESCRVVELKKEEIDTRFSLGRTTYEPHYAKISSPHFTASAMDGIAVNYLDTLEADITKPVFLENSKYEVVDTGDLIRDDFDAVIMVEDIEEVDGGVIIRKPVVPYQNIRPIGEDIAMGTMILPSKHKIRAIDISSLLAAGINKVSVYERIKVGIIPTGDELVNVWESPEKGQLIDFNSWTFAAMIEEWGGKPIRYDIIRDSYELIRDSLKRAVDECHMVILNAGSAKGREDFTEEVLKSLGEVKFHGVSIKPGRPASFALVNDKPIFGVPGYPVSAFFVMDNLVKDALYTIKNETLRERERVEAYISRKIVSSLKNDEFLRVKLGKVGEKLVASPLGRGAGVTMSLTNADGIVKIDKNHEGIEAGDKVIVEILKNRKNIDKTLVSIGSHDMVMDIISDFMNIEGYDLSSSHVGSMGGIMALKRNEAHIAPIHLLGENGIYNIDYVKKYLGDYIILKLIKRVQGFMVQKGNPLNIKDFKDLTRIRYVNRQKGSGTRLLLDYFLEKKEVDKNDINGYTREELTHLTVAAQIAGGSGDCGLGVLSAATCMNLDFIPIANEDYDIVFHKSMLEDERFKCFYKVITSKGFKDKVMSIGGYDLKDTGKIIYV